MSIYSGLVSNEPICIYVLFFRRVMGIFTAAFNFHYNMPIFYGVQAPDLVWSDGLGREGERVCFFQKIHSHKIRYEQMKPVYHNPPKLCNATLNHVQKSC